MLPAIKQIINDMPLRRKISAIIVVVNLFFVYVISLVGLQVVVKANNRILYGTLESTLGYSASELRNNLRTAENLTRTLIADNLVQEQLAQLKVNSDKSSVRAAAYRGLSTQLQAYQTQFVQGDIAFMNIDAADMTVSTNIARTHKISAALLEEITQEAIRQDGRCVWKIEGQTLVLMRTIRRTHPLRLDTLGVLTVAFDLQHIIARCTNFSQNFDSTYYFIMEDGKVAYAPQGIADNLQQIAAEAPAPYSVQKWDGHRFFAVRGTVPGKAWEYVCLVSYDSIYHAIALSRGFYAVVMLAGIMIAIVVSNLLMSRITRHIDNLIVKMKAFGQNRAERVDVCCDYSTRSDELGVLHRSFDRMADEIVALIQTDYTNKLLMKDAQIKALETQIDPHFLYNVLASINWRAKAIGEANISQMVEALSSLLRATLSDSAEPFTLCREMQLVNSYATIQQLRFEDELFIESDVPQALQNAALPKLTIQPLVENAVRYAMEQSTEPCFVNITARQQAGELKIIVANTGSQFEDDFLQRLIEGKISIQGFGIGITNIQKRLQLTFGEPYGLTFCNADGRAVVTITIPYRPIL